MQTGRRELLDRTLIWDQRHLLHALHEFEKFYNSHRPHRSLGQRAPLDNAGREARERPPDIGRLRRRDRLGGLIHEYELAA